MSTLADLVTQLRKDYHRHDSTWRNPTLWAMAVYRVGVWGQEIQNPIAREIISKAYGAMHLGIQLTTGFVIHREAKIGSDFHLIHCGNTKIHPDVVIGDGCGIMHDVTIGTNMDRPGVPRLGNNVFVGAGPRYWVEYRLAMAHGSQPTRSWYAMFRLARLLSACQREY